MAIEQTPRKRRSRELNSLLWRLPLTQQRRGHRSLCPFLRRPHGLPCGQVRWRADRTAMIVAASARRHTDLMTLFLPNARATNWLLIVGFCSIGFALYMRYLAVEQSTVGLACQAGLNTWLCFTRQITIVLFTYSVFGWFALIVAALNFIRPSLVLFAIALAAACCGVVLYNVGLSSLAAGLLVVSLSRRAPEPD